MNTQDTISARRSRLSHQTQILCGGEQPRFFHESGAPDIDKERAPFVLRDIGVPPDLSGATLANSKFSEVDEVRNWLIDILNRETGEYFALLIGDGSNYTAAALLRNAVKRGRTVSWYTWHNFTKRYTDGIERGHRMSSRDPEDVAEAIFHSDAAAQETDYLHQVYEMLAIVDFNINDVRDFAVPEILALIRERTSFGLATVITVPMASSAPLSHNAINYGARGDLLTLFEHEAVVFDGR